MFHGKMKAITFSYDDGVVQDRRLIELFNKYNLKGTFNLNSEFLGVPHRFERDGVKMCRNRVSPEEVKDLYAGHEVAVHTLTHPNLTTCSDEEIIRQVEEDRKNLEKLVGYDVIGMAYPCGGVNNDDRVSKIIKENTKIKYSRTITSTMNFELQENLYAFNPTVHHMNKDGLMELAKEFVGLDAKEPKIFYVWGHAYEFDETDIGWDVMEEFCKIIANKDDIFYGTNREVLL